MIDLKIEGATRIVIHFGDNVRVSWPHWSDGLEGWDIWTGGQFLMSLSTMNAACEWAQRYVDARTEADGACAV